MTMEYKQRGTNHEIVCQADVHRLQIDGSTRFKTRGRQEFVTERDA